MCPKPRLTVQFLSPERTIVAIQILAGVFQAENQAPQKITVCSTGVNIFDKNTHNPPHAVKFNCLFVVLLYVNTIYLSLDQERIFWQSDSQEMLRQLLSFAYNHPLVLFLVLCILEVMPSSMNCR